MRTRTTRNSRPRVETLEGRAMMTGAVLAPVAHHAAAVGLHIHSQSEHVTKPTRHHGSHGTHASVAAAAGGSIRIASTGGTGYVVGPVGGKANAVLVQPTDGKIVVAGRLPYPSTPYTGFGLVRYNPDGTPDTSFGSGGQVVTLIANGGGVINGTALQADGKIVAVGEAFVLQKNASAKDEFAVARYTASGALDTTFGGTRNKNGTVSNAGEAFLSFGSGKDVATAVALETVNGAMEIVVAGWTNSVTGHPEIALARYNPNGTLDTTFGTGGTVVMGIPNTSDYPEVQAVAVQPDGKVVVAGRTNGPGPYPAFLARFNINGSLDTTFGNNGLVLTHFTSQDEFYGVALQPDGRIVAAGDGNGFGEVARFNADGTLDTTFGGGAGFVMAPDPSQGSWYYGVALQADGQILAAGSGPNFTAFVTRYNADGSLDTTYGSGGSATTSLGVVAQYNAVAIQPADGEAVAAGYMSYTWPTTYFLTSRYTTAGALDTTF